MRSVLIAAFAAFAVLDLGPAVQDPEPGAAATVPALADRCFGGGEASRAAMNDLAALVERDYPAVFAVWEQEPEGRRRTLLESVLHLPTVRAAATIVGGAIARVEAVQGGVVDYHHVLVHFAGPDGTGPDGTGLVVLRATADRADLEAGYCAVLRGTSWDTWLGAQLRANLERVQGPRVWLFAPLDLAHRRVGATERAVLVQEWSTLPATALPCLRRLLR